MAEKAGRLLSVNVGLPRDVAWHGRTVHRLSGNSRLTAHVRCGG